MAFANFYGINTPTLADFQLSACLQNSSALTMEQFHPAQPLRAQGHQVPAPSPPTPPPHTSSLFLHLTAISISEDYRSFYLCLSTPLPEPHNLFLFQSQAVLGEPPSFTHPLPIFCPRLFKPSYLQTCPGLLFCKYLTDPTASSSFLATVVGPVVGKTSSEVTESGFSAQDACP